jgi:hypothetical protein
MQPQNVQPTNQPQGQPQQTSPAYSPPPSPAPMPPVSPAPQKSRGKLITYALVGLLLVAMIGGALYVVVSSRQNDSALPSSTKHVGSSPYVHACNAFTAEDFDAVVGAKSNRSSIETKFASETDTAKPGRSYISTCTRRGLNDLSIGLTVHQYTNKPSSRDMFVLGLNDAPEDSDFGGPASYRSQQFTFQRDNKVTSVLIQGYGDMDDEAIQALAKAAAKKASDRMTKVADLATLNYPAKLAGEGYTYHNACSLWGLSDFEEQFGGVDKTSVEMTYAEDLATQTQSPGEAARSTHSECVLGTKSIGGSYAYIDAYYYPNEADAKAGYDSYTSPDDDIPLPEFGNNAVLRAYDAAAQQYEGVMILAGTTMFQLKFVPEDDAIRGNSQVQKDVKAMARTVLERLQ